MAVWSRHYTLHKPVRKRFPPNPYTVPNIDDIWEMDLADLSSLSRYNDIRGLLEKYPTFGREKETGLLGALDT